jgi:peptidoglycan/xylan/chitin deacetylase (PgdA/CDA1 family)
MNWKVWTELEALLVYHNLKPILAVVPDNQDNFLRVADPIDTFWDKVRTWQSLGWSIGLHGYQHTYVTEDSGLMRLQKYSEFAGLPEAAQESKLLKALDVFHREGVRPDLWIAPGHSFDTTTLSVLRRIGIDTLCDGFALYPHRDVDGMFWIPQQVWHFRHMPLGTWTICWHVNDWSSRELHDGGEQLKRFSEEMTSVAQVREQYGARKELLAERVFSAVWNNTLSARRLLKAGCLLRRGK